MNTSKKRSEAEGHEMGSPLAHDLIRRLEEAKEGSRDLSWAVAEAIGWTKYWFSMTIYVPPGETEDDSPNASPDLPQFTTSLDVALTLVPDGYAWEVGGDPKWQMEIPPHARVTPIGHQPSAWTFKATPALALCIAALKARAALQSAMPGANNE